MRPSLPIALSFSLLCSSACHPGFLPAREIGVGEAVQLRVGESGTIRDLGARFRVDSILDSRCPADVTCIAAGGVSVFFSVDMKNGVWIKGALSPGSTHNSLSVGSHSSAAL